MNLGSVENAGRTRRVFVNFQFQFSKLCTLLLGRIASVAGHPVSDPATPNPGAKEKSRIVDLWSSSFRLLICTSRFVYHKHATCSSLVASLTGFLPATPTSASDEQQFAKQALKPGQQVRLDLPRVSFQFCADLHQLRS